MMIQPAMIDIPAKEPCRVCGDLGMVVCPGCDAQRTPCARCDGRGEVPCPACETRSMPRYGRSILEKWEGYRCVVLGRAKRGR